MTAVRLADFVKAYDVRGLVPEQLSPEVATALGSAFAQVVVLPEGESGVVVGHDMRASSPGLSQAFAAGVAAHGVDVTTIGLCSTDGLYYASGALDVPGAMFTASHNPAQYNGIKLCRAGARPVGRDSGLAEIRDLAQWLLDRGEVHHLGGSDRIGSITERDLLADYAGFLRELVDLSDGRRASVTTETSGGVTRISLAVKAADGTFIAVDSTNAADTGTGTNTPTRPTPPLGVADLVRIAELADLHW